jgi:hypothetical protein
MVSSYSMRNSKEWHKKGMNMFIIGKSLHLICKDDIISYMADDSNDELIKKS